MTALDSATLCPKHSPATGVAPWRTVRPDCKACDKLQALADLRALLPPGSTVYTILRSVSRSGMSRVITPIMLDPVDGKPLNIVGLVRQALGYPAVEVMGQVGLKLSGAGMDMGFHLVRSLSVALHGVPADALIPRNQWGNDRPGYTLTHRWL